MLGSGWRRISVLMPVALAAVAVKVIEPVPPVAVTVMLSPLKEPAGGVRGMVPAGVTWRNLTLNATKML